ncbi:unnamed protein product [Rotaria socialis]|nr:unnamed protein product [Rotaria socialis]CAF3370122.1 unnamed protein product [Rotaria socialis]CAF3492935.1 unnamed protein product [Rotaria socialis]
MIQPYSPPAKILRCFNCQQYNDHIAANCPPTKFAVQTVVKAVWLVVQAAHNNNNNKVLHVKSTGASGAWATNALKEHTQTQLYTPVHNVTLNEYPDPLSDINKKFDQIMNKMEQITNEQKNINASEAFLGAEKQTEQEKLRPIFMKFKQQYEVIVESHDIKQNEKPILSKSTSNEAIST